MMMTKPWCLSAFNRIALINNKEKDGTRMTAMEQLNP